MNFKLFPTQIIPEFLDFAGLEPFPTLQAWTHPIPIQAGKLGIRTQRWALLGEQCPGVSLLLLSLFFRDESSKSILRQLGAVRAFPT